MTPNPEFQQVVEANFGKEDKIVVGCKMSGRSAQAVAVLEAAGYTNIAHMRGGFSGERDMYGRVSAPGWAESGLPVANQPAPGASYAELAKEVRRRAARDPGFLVQLDAALLQRVFTMPLILSSSRT